MKKDPAWKEGAAGTARAQAGKLLCLSETIYPDDTRQGVNPVYRSQRAGGGILPAPQSRMTGGEFVDLRRLNRDPCGQARRPR